ncbi:MSMEG_0569 family flavin-dependent oxidoreductase [Methylobrevis pamukkalensis]|uniref:Putative oxidoreductase CzcO n=1 Tax=Methylobrevis pamukkalensis TaxID=1439726 RepID=A0A1E3H3U8_9HYPH|nr:MSMEG_0569 family flavin-dependent oxidoreductase [Methylobrevis pamukkalensis]ODN71027.1 putative oxidoreductase CzcO [Methylobrevis pamukkalensis]
MNVSTRVQHVPVAVVGGGQAGLSVSWHLDKAGIDHVVLEKNRAFHTWKTERWDNFCLVTPNWQCQLPGHGYDGDDPKGFMVRDEIIAWLDRWLEKFAPPLKEGVSVARVSQLGEGFLLDTSDGLIRADQVVFAAGGYQIPVIPRAAERIPEDVVQIHSSIYRNADQLPEGKVLVVGSGQSGAQIAEDLHLAGRKVHLGLGDAPRVARRYRGKDVVEWLYDMGYYDLSVDVHPLREGVRDKTNHYVTGRDGGRDIDLRQRALEGMELHGHFVDARGDRVIFADTVASCLDEADAVSESIKSSIDGFIAKNGIEAPEEARYVPVWTPTAPRCEIDLRAEGITSIVWCIGFRTDWSWVDLPVFNGRGQPQHHRGVTSVDGAYFLGLPWLHTWGSGRFSGVARDAEHIARQILARHGEEAAASDRLVNDAAIGS